MSEIRPGYKQTEVGVIPEDWEVERVGDAFEVCDQFRMPISRDNRKNMEGLYPYYGPTSVQGYINEYRVEGEYALIGEDGDHFLKWRYQKMTLLVNGKFNVNNHAHLIKGVKNLTSWVYYYFMHRDLTPHLKRQGAGRYKLNKATLMSLPCALPPTLAEQTAITAVLSDTDALIQIMDQLIAKKRNINQGTMQELLTGKRRLPGFSGAWEVKKLGEVADIDSDNLGSTTDPGYVFKYISLEGVDNGILKTYSEQEFQYAPSRARRKIKRGDILVSTVRPNLKSHMCFSLDSPNWICSTGFSVVRCNVGQVNSDYIFQHFFADTISNQIDTLLTGSNYPAINSKDVRDLRILLPPTLAEQTAIATVLSDMDAEIVVLEQKRDKYKAVKQGMMQVLLTGKVRLV